MFRFINRLFKSSDDRPAGTQGFLTAAGEPAPASLVVTHAEVCTRHGSGALLLRILEGQENLIVARSEDHFLENHAGDVTFKLNHDGLTRPQVYARALEAFGDYAISRILCVPFFANEILTAIAAHDIFGAPLCLYVMDDQNIFEQKISDEMMREIIAKSRIRLAAGPQLRDAYEEKFGASFHLLPPIVSGTLFPPAEIPSRQPASPPRGALVGNLWNKTVTMKFRETVAGSGIPIDWFGNAGKPFLDWDPDDLAKDGIHMKGQLPEEDLAVALREYDFAVVPSGTMDDEDEQLWLSALSLPSRITFIMASSHLPIVVLGSPQTAAALSVAELGIGANSAYDSEAFKKAVAEVTAPERRSTIARAASEKGEFVRSEGVGDWIWSSLEKGQPMSDDMDSFIPRSAGSGAPSVE